MKFKYIVRNIIAGMPAIMIVLFGAFSLELAGGQASHIDTAAVQAISLRSLGGTYHTGTSFRQNTATVFVFLSESCPICQKYTPTLRALWAEYAQNNIGFYGVFPESSLDIDSVESFQRTYRLPFPLLFDTAQKLTTLLGARITPEVVVLSSEYEVLYQGRIDDLFPVIGRKRYKATTHELRDALMAILAGKVVQVKKTEAVGCFIEPK
ncbi:MAG: redoxin domain-containing protein [Candidatus Kapaibacterium sp.]